MSNYSIAAKSNLQQSALSKHQGIGDGAGGIVGGGVGGGGTGVAMGTGGGRTIGGTLGRCFGGGGDAGPILTGGFWIGLGGAGGAAGRCTLAGCCWACRGGCDVLFACSVAITERV